MQTLIPRAMKKRIARERARLGISEQEYVSNAPAHYRHLLALDSKLKEDLNLWDVASSTDFVAFSKRNKT